MTPSARSLDHNRAPDRCANAARAVVVHSRRDGANSTNVPPGSIPACRADRCYPLLRLLLRRHPHHFRGDARDHEDAVGVVEVVDAAAAAAGAVEVNAAEIAVAVASVVVAAAAAGVLRRTTARTLRRLAFVLGLCDG